MAIVAEDRRIAPASDRDGPGRRLPRAVETGPVTITGARIFLPRRCTRSSAHASPSSTRGSATCSRAWAASSSTFWPEILREQDARNDRLRDQVAPGTWWNDKLPATFDDHRAPILGQVSVGSFMTDLLRRFGVRPDAAIGYSMGESAALVALGAWTDRDEMTRRLVESPLFATELAGPCHAARRAWGLEPGEPVDWVAGIVPRSAAAVRGGDPRPAPRLRPDHELGRGDRDRRPAFRRASGRERAELPVPRAADRQHGPLRDRPGRRGGVPRAPRPAHVRGGRHRVLQRRLGPALRARSRERPPRPSRRRPRTRSTSRPWSSEPTPTVSGSSSRWGPGGSCTRLIGRILGDRPHLACSACLPDRDALCHGAGDAGRPGRPPGPGRPRAASSSLTDGPEISSTHAAGPHAADPRREIRIEPGLPPLRAAAIARASSQHAYRAGAFAWSSG